MPQQIEGGVGGDEVSRSMVDAGHSEIPITCQFNPSEGVTDLHISADQLKAMAQVPALSLAQFTGVSFPPGSLNNNSSPVGVVVDQGQSNGVPRQMAPKTSRRFFITQRGDATAETAHEDRTAVVGVSHVLPVGVDSTTTKHDFHENIFTGDGAPLFKLPVEDFTDDAGAALIKKSCVWAEHHGQSVEQVLSGCVEATKGETTRIAVPLNQGTAISKLVTSKLDLGAKKLTTLFPTSRVHPDRVVHIKNEHVHPTDTVPHVVLTKADAEQAAAKLAENLRPHAFHGGLNVSIHPLDSALSEPVTVNMMLHRKPMQLPDTKGPVHMSHNIVAKAIGSTAGASSVVASGADGTINAIFAHDCNDGADKAAVGGSLVQTSAPGEEPTAPAPEKSAGDE